jgi:uncharacterized protein (TIGR01619 family)
MDGNWEFYPVKVEGQPASIFLDLALAADAPLPGYPTVGFLRLYLRTARPDGMAAQEEFADLVALEDALIPRVVGEQQAVFAGRSTGRGMRDLFFYVYDRERFEREVISALIPFEAYKFEIGHRDDPQWTVYFDFLYPTPLDLQRISNRQVTDQLREHGDDLGKERPIDHSAVFNEAGPAAAFVAWATTHGYAVLRNGEEPDEQDRHIVNIVRDDIPAEIDLIALPVFERVTALGGIYDGWGCQVTD